MLPRSSKAQPSVPRLQKLTFSMTICIELAFPAPNQLPTRSFITKQRTQSSQVLCLGQVGGKCGALERASSRFKENQNMKNMKRQNSGPLKLARQRSHQLLNRPLHELTEELKLKAGLPLQDLQLLLTQTSSLLQQQPNLLTLKSPLTVVGDIHGQYFDLLNIFERFGSAETEQYLFLGDYVDRGKFCIEVMTLMLLLKLRFPKQIHLLRGNHESRTMTTYYNFRLECQKKYNSDLYERFLDLFAKMPLAAVVDNKYFAVHAGISPNAALLNDIRRIDRFVDIPQEGALCDLVWSDPGEEGRTVWEKNKMRGCSYYYGRNEAEGFLARNQLKIIIRAHQVQMKGYKYQLDAKKQPLTLTLFSAPNYCDKCANKAAVAFIDGPDLTLSTFMQVKHPFVPDNYLNAFDLSCPLLAAGITNIFKSILNSSKLKRSLKSNSNDFSSVLQKLDNVGEMINLFNINVNHIDELFSSAGQLELQPSEENCQEANEKRPIIFGPKRLEFVKISLKDQGEDLSPAYELD